MKTDIKWYVAKPQTGLARMLTLLSIPIIGYFPNSAIAFFKFTSVNKALVGFAYQTAENLDWIHCIEACQQDSPCISYNSWPGMFGRRCELDVNLM